MAGMTEKRAREIIANGWGYGASDSSVMQEDHNKAEGYLEGIAKAEKLEEALEDLLTHPAFTEGTKMWSELPRGLPGRALDANIKLAQWRKER